MKTLLASLLLTASAFAADVGRYQLVTATVLVTLNGTSGAAPAVLRIDTATGQVWQLLSVRVDSTNTTSQWLDITPARN